MNVSFQGLRLTASQRRQLEFQRAASEALHASHLRQQVAETLAELDRRKEQGVKRERVWYLDYEERGTPCIAEMLGY